MVETSTDCAASSTTRTSKGAVWSMQGRPEEFSVLNTRWASSCADNKRTSERADDRTTGRANKRVRAVVAGMTE